MTFGNTGNRYTTGGTSNNATFNQGFQQGGTSTGNAVFSYGANQSNINTSNQRTFDNAAIGLATGQNAGYTTTSAIGGQGGYTVNTRNGGGSQVNQGQTRYVEPLRYENRIESAGQPYYQQGQIVNQGAQGSGEYHNVIHSYPENRQTVISGG